MTTADQKEVKVHEFIAENGFAERGEHILCAIIIGPDRDEPGRKTLHLRMRGDAFDLIKALPIGTRQMMMEHMDRLLGEFREMVLESRA